MWFAIFGSAMALETAGYAELRGVYTGGVEGTPWQIVERIRPSFRAEIGSEWSAHITLEAQGVQGRWDRQVAYELVEEQIGSVLESAQCPLDSPGKRVSAIQDIVSIDRLFLDYYGPSFDLRVGRQALNWGSAQTINPTDLFSEILVAEPWRERRGVNAARVNWAWNNGGQLTAVATLDDALEKAKFGLRPTWNIWQTDLSPVLAFSSDSDVFLGADLRGQKGVGWWLEGGGLLGEEGWRSRLSVGIDTSFLLREGWVWGVQYSYDGGGIADPSDYTLAARGSVLVPSPSCDEALETFDFPEEAEPRFTIGRHYGLFWTRLGWSDEWTLQATGLVNLQDRSSFISPSLAWTPGERVSVNAGTQWLLGEGEFAPGVQVTRVDFGEGASTVTLDFEGLVPSWSFFSYLRVAL